MFDTISSIEGTGINVKKVEILVLPGLLERANYSEWGTPYFAQPKPKSNWVHFISNVRKLNK